MSAIFLHSLWFDCLRCREDCCICTCEPAKMFVFGKNAEKRKNMVDGHAPLAAGCAQGGTEVSDAQSEIISDLFIIGGGINGCGIARDASGHDLSGGTGRTGQPGARHLLGLDQTLPRRPALPRIFRVPCLVREALEERETLLVAMPHISWPMRFVLPLSPEMRFESDTPTSRLLRWVMLVRAAARTG